jgi:hypothetical protein
MPVDDQIASAQQSMHAAAQHPEKQVRTRQSDEGPAILPGMQHFVTLLRKAKRPGACGAPGRTYQRDRAA